MKTFLNWTCRILSMWAVMGMLVFWLVGYAERSTAEEQMQSYAKFNRELIRIEGNRDGRYGENFSANGTYIGDAKVVILVDARR